MEKNKEAVKKSCPDFYTSKKVDASKTTYLKNNTHLSVRSDKGRNKVSYISREKNAPIPIDKKYNFYGNDAKSFIKHSCDKCGVKARPHLVLNAASTNSSIAELTQIESGHDLNGNISFSTHPTLCNFSTSVSEVSTLNKVLSYQPNQHYDLSLPKSSKHKPRNTFLEQKAFSSRVTHSNNSYTTGRFFSSLPNSTIRCHCSKSIPQSYTASEPYFKTSHRSSCNIITVNEKYNSKYDKYATLSETSLNNDGVKLTDLPVFVNSNSLKDPSMTCKVDYFEEQLQIKKQRNYSTKKWDHIPMMSEFGENSKSLDEADKMLFPALPSNNHSQQTKLNSGYSSMPPSEHSSVENSDLEIPHSLSGTNVTLNASTYTPSIPSTTPQASYADVIRMSATCSGVQGYIALDNDKTIPEQNPLLLANSIQEKLPKDENPQPGSSDWVISRLSQLDLNTPEPLSSIALTHYHQNGQNFVAPRPIVVSLEKPSFYNSSLQTCKNVLSVLPSNITFPPTDKKVVENDSLADDCLSSLEKSSLDSSLLPGSTNRSSVSSDFTTSMTDTQIASIKTDSVYSSPSSVSSFGDAFKPTENRDLNIDGLLKREPPVIIMNNCSPPDNMSEISFGIEYEEMVKLCSDSCNVEDSILLSVQDAGEDSLSDKSIKTGNSHPKSSIPLLPENISPPTMSEIETSINKSISVKGKTLYWKDSDVDYNKNNHAELAEYLGGVWNDIGKEFEKEKGLPHVNGSIHYFHEL